MNSRMIDPPITAAQAKHSVKLFERLTLVKSLNVFKRDVEKTGEAFSQINRSVVEETVFVDPTIWQDVTYEYRIASIVDGHAEVKSEGVLVLTGGVE